MLKCRTDQFVKSTKNVEMTLQRKGSVNVFCPTKKRAIIRDVRTTWLSTQQSFS